jgi:hypothetical protein
MPDIYDDSTLATVPAQPEAIGPMRKRMPLVLILVGVVVLIGLTNLVGLLSSNKKEAPKSPLAARPSVANSQQVGSLQTQQNAQARQDEEQRERQQQLAAQMAVLQSESTVPGPESPTASPMTPAQREAIYGNSPNAPQKTSGASQANAEAKQRALAREKQRQDAQNSDTVAIDFAHPAATGAAQGPVQGTDVAADSQAASSRAEGASDDTESYGGVSGGRSGGQTNLKNVVAQPNKHGSKDPMAGSTSTSTRQALPRLRGHGSRRCCDQPDRRRLCRPDPCHAHH